MDATDTEATTVQAVDEIEQAIEADEAKWKAEGRSDSESDAGQARDESGRFTSPNNAERAGTEATDDGTPDGEGQPTNQQSDQQQQQATQDGPKSEVQSPKPKAEAKPEDGSPKSEAQSPKAGQSAFAKDNQRRDRSWQALNAEKQTVAQEKEQLRLEREQLQAQQEAAVVQKRDERGHTATDYETHAKHVSDQAAQLRGRAIQAEAEGKFAEADAFNEQAGKKEEIAGFATQRAQGLRGTGPDAVWAQLKADLPEAMQFGGPINVEIRQALLGNKQLKADPMGPYRAAVQVGRKVLQATEQKLASASTEAAKVPGLLKQIEELSARVTELQRVTSIPGGGAIISRGGGGGKAFADMSLAEMEAELARMQPA